MDEDTATLHLSPYLFWDMDMSKGDIDTCPSQIISRVLECGTLNDWFVIRKHYGLDRIVEECRNLRTLEPVALAFICAISGTKKETYRCCNTNVLSPTR